MIKTTKLLIISIGLLSSACATAEAIPTRTKFDNRTRTINYNPQQVFRISSYWGFTTTIILNKNEKYQAHALGDPSAWDFAQQDNYIFIRPKAKNADTNLFVLTNKRHYNFDLRAFTDRIYKNNEVDFFTVTFRYPALEAQKRRLKAEQKRLEHSLKVSQSLIVNTHYTGCGDKSIAPMAIYDNNMHTYFKFPLGTPLPAIYVLKNGKEQLINYNVENDWVVVHMVAKEFILRNSDTVACVINNGEVKSLRGQSNTISNDVHREVNDD